MSAMASAPMPAIGTEVRRGDMLTASHPSAPSVDNRWLNRSMLSTGSHVSKK